MDLPETRYARTADGVHIAYQTLGDGPVDFVYVGPSVTHMRRFEDAGEHQLKGIPEHWRLFRVAAV